MRKVVSFGLPGFIVSFFLTVATMALGSVFGAPESFFRICFGLGVLSMIGFASCAIFDS